MLVIAPRSSRVLVRDGTVQRGATRIETTRLKRLSR